ncbi:MAG: glycosyltransferase [Geminicoccaceae bacterium]
MDPLPLLVLVRNITRTLSYHDDWQDAACSHPGFASDVEDIEIEENHPRIRQKIEAAPFIVALHATNANGTEALGTLSGALKHRRGKLAVFVGNEVNLPYPTMRSKLDFLQQVQPELIATQLIEETGQWYYRVIEGAVIRNITHGINPAAFKPGPPLAARPIDVGARSDRYNIYVGDELRVKLYEAVDARARERGLSADIVLGAKRFDRQGWASFLGRSKITIATEAGSDFLDRDDRLSAQISARLRDHQGSRMVIQHQSTARSLSRKLLPRPARHWIARRLGNLIVEDVHLHQTVDDQVSKTILDQVFRPERRAPHHTKCISSRHFDAAACKTVQILTAGRYNDMLEAGKHYIELDQDFRNLDDVLEQCRDVRACQQLVDDAFDDLMSRHTYGHRMTALEQALRIL